jgi:hypothetical protein
VLQQVVESGEKGLEGLVEYLVSWPQAVHAHHAGQVSPKKLEHVVEHGEGRQRPSVCF